MIGSRTNDAGFTLIEMLVAVFALALLMGAGGRVLLATLESKRLLDMRLERLQAMELVSAYLETDLANAVPRLIEGEFAGSGFQSFFGGQPNRERVILGLVHGGWTNLDAVEDRSELLVVEYRFDGGALVRRLLMRPDATRQTPKFDEVLIEGLETVTVRFSAGGGVSDQWDLVLDTDYPLLPDAVIFDLHFVTGETLSQSFLVGGRQS